MTTGADPGHVVGPRHEPGRHSANAFDLEYVAALTDDLTEACQDFASGAGRRLTVGERFHGVEVTFRRHAPGGDVPDGSPPGTGTVTATLRRGWKPRDEHAAIPSGWHAEPTQHKRRVAAAGPYPEGPELAHELVELCISALAWAPAALPPHVEIRIRFDGFGSKPQMKRQRQRRQAQRERALRYDRAIRRAALARWEDARQQAITTAPTDDEHTARLRRDIDDIAWEYLRPAAGDGDPQPHEPLLTVENATLLMSEARAVPDWRPPPRDELYWFSDAARMVVRCREGFAHAWRTGDLQTARALLDEILRIGSPRDDDAARAARARLELALLDGDLEVALVAGAAAMRRTGFETLLDYMVAGRMLPEVIQGGFLEELCRRADEVTDLDEPERAGREEVAAVITHLTMALENVVAAHHRLHMLLRDPYNGQASFWFDIDRAGLMVSTTLAPDDTPAAQRRVERLKAEGFTVDGAGVGAQVRLWASHGGEVPPEQVLERSVRLAVELLEELYDEDVTLLGWDGLSI